MQKTRLLLLLSLLLLILTIVNAKILVYEDEENQCPIVLMQQTSVPRERETEPLIPQELVCCYTKDGYAKVFQDYCISELRGNIASDAMCAQVCCQQQVKGMSVSRWEKGLAGNCRAEGLFSHPEEMCKTSCCKINTPDGPAWHNKVSGDEPISIGLCQEMGGEVLLEEACNDVCCKYRSPKTGLEILSALGPTACKRNGGEKIDIPVESCNSYTNELQPGLTDITVCCKVTTSQAGMNTRHEKMTLSNCKNLAINGVSTEVASLDYCNEEFGAGKNSLNTCDFDPSAKDNKKPSTEPISTLRVHIGETIRYQFEGPPSETRCFKCAKGEPFNSLDEVNCRRTDLRGFDWDKERVRTNDRYRFGISNACIFGPTITGEPGSTAVTINLEESVRYTYQNGVKGCFTCSYPESGDWVPQLKSVNCNEVSRAYDLSAERMEGITPEGLRGSYSPITGQSFRTIKNSSTGFFSKIAAFFYRIIS
ncbi:hypothetical protein HZA97_09950 [Candidatus Woesearchaeota archaeon]|nr:hypothetical protein [Candidatus Woesearchaeota archaeon]